jgi:hypothetical protein
VGRRRLGLLITLLAALLPEAVAAQEEVDLELCLAADGSGSITPEEFRFQREGYAAAIADGRVVGAVRSGFLGRIALAHMEWGGPDSMHPIVDWSLIADEASARDFGARLIAAPRLAIGYNSISNAIAFCRTWMEGNGYEGIRRVIDVSGDAGQRGGMLLADSRFLAVESGITINALALDFRGGGMSGPLGMGLVTHFERDVIGGPGAFALSVDDPAEFVESLVRKLVLEIAGIPTRGGTTDLAKADAAGSTLSP